MGVMKMSFWGEFKEFISKGNVVDMAVGVVVGGAFKSIVDSLVADIIMPAISILTGKVNITELAFKVNDNLSITYGVFLQNILNFLIIAFTIFCVIKGMNTVREKFEKKKEEETATETVPEITAEEKLLTEIRDLLKQSK